MRIFGTYAYEHIICYVSEIPFSSRYSKFYLIQLRSPTFFEYIGEERFHGLRRGRLEKEHGIGWGRGGKNILCCCLIRLTNEDPKNSSKENRELEIKIQ